MLASRRPLVVVSLSLLAACASSPGTNPPAASVAGTFTKTVAPAIGFNNAYPFHAGNDYRVQGLYLAAEVGAAGRIVALRFVRGTDNAVAVTCPAVTVRLGHSTLTSLGASFAGNGNASSLAPVASGATVTIPAGVAGTWFDLPLTTPYDYDGVENLLVDLESPAPCTGTVNVGTLSAPSRRLLSVGVDAGPSTYEHSTTSGSIDSWPPGLQLAFQGGDTRFVFDGALGSNNFPLSDRAGGLRWQNLHLASDLAGAGPITGVGFEASTATTATFVYSMRLGHTTASALSAAPFDGFSSDWVEVARSVTVTVPGVTATGSWVWMPMPDGTFTYDGRDNLVVEIRIFSGTAPFPLRVSTRTTGRHFAHTDFPEPGVVDSMATHTAFRFAGAPVTITAPPGTFFPATQPFGGGHSGQIMSLYEGTRVGSSGTITRLGLRLSQASAAATVPSYRVYLGTTAKARYQTAETYASSLDGATLVYSGSLVVPAGVAANDWIDIPLQTGFPYDASRSLSLLIMADQGSAANAAATLTDSNAWPGHAVGRNDNAAALTDTPTWITDGAVAVKLTVQ